MTVNRRRTRFIMGNLGEMEWQSAENKNRCKSLTHSGLRSRGDWTALELFLAGVEGWGEDVKHLLLVA